MSRTHRRLRELQYWEKKEENKALGNNPIFQTEFTGVIRMDFLSGEEIQSVQFLGNDIIGHWDRPHRGAWSSTQKNATV